MKQRVPQKQEFKLLMSEASYVTQNYCVIKRQKFGTFRKAYNKFCFAPQKSQQYDLLYHTELLICSMHHCSSPLC
jgi:hypothetical protein